MIQLLVSSWLMLHLAAAGTPKNCVKMCVEICKTTQVSS